MTTSSDDQSPQHSTDKKAPTDTDDNVENLQQVYIAIGKLFIGLLTNPKMLDLLKQNVVIGNLVTVFLLGSTGFGIYQKVNLGAYNEKPISQDTLDDICKDKEKYEVEITERFRNDGASFDPDAYDIKGQGVVLSDAKDVYPVFRWACEYTLSPKQASEPANRDYGDIMFNTIRTGIDLDSYCEEKFGDESYGSLTKATYHDHTNPHSWHCTNPDSDSL